jgi:hypothetical protein
MRAFVAKYPWRFAKTMPQFPHEYLVKAKTVPAAEFDAFATEVIARGEYKRMVGKPKHYLELDGWRYWTMEQVSIEESTILNRERVKPVAVQLDLFPDEPK